MTDLLVHLNAPQAKAAGHTEGPLLILAGAGTGKTRVLTHRIAHIMLQGLARPFEILAVTFTNKAAKEMVERVEQLVGANAHGMWLGTFHALCVRILRKYPEAAGLAPNFTILDADDQTRVLKELITQYHLDEKRWPARQLANVISRFKDNAWRPEDVPEGENWFADGKAVQLYAAYQARLKALNCADFGDLLLKTLVLFKDNPDILNEYQTRFKYILVDEYQDTNVVQYLWLRLLAMQHHNICVVGDDDQSIYAWRGAQVGNILRFEQDYPGAEVVRLEQNYRSTANILKAASSVIAHNKERHGKTLWTEGAAGDKVEIHPVRDDWEEARTVAQRINTNLREGAQCSDHAILVRTAAQTRSFEEQFLKDALPYQVIGGLRFYERKEVRDAVAYLRLIYSPRDNLAFNRIVNVPKRGIGDSALQDLNEIAQSHHVSLFEAAKLGLEHDLLSARVKKPLAAFVEVIDALREKIEDATPDLLMEDILETSGYMEMLRTDKNKEEARGRMENLKELVRAMQEYADVEAFLEHVSLVMDREEETADSVKVMTVHAAKGLEFEKVFIPGFEEGLFPHQRSLNEEGQKGLEEERRLAYVAMTRAKKELALLYTASRRMYGQWQPSTASRFLTEIPEDCSVIIGGKSQGYGGGYSGFRAQPGSAMDCYGADVRKTRQPMLAMEAENSFPENDFDYSDDLPMDAEHMVGLKVRHAKFGKGRIIALEGQGDNTKVTVRFERAGVKKLMAMYANLQPV